MAKIHRWSMVYSRPQAEFMETKHGGHIHGYGAPIFASNVVYVSKPINNHDDVIKCKHFPRYWPFVRGIYRSPVNSPHRGQLNGALMFYLICAGINDWVNNHEAGDLRRHCAHYDVNVMNNQIPCHDVMYCEWPNPQLQMATECHPDGHWTEYYNNTLQCSQDTATHLKIGYQWNLSTLTRSSSEFRWNEW